MRFPRIKKIRLESIDGDEKKPSEASTDEEIWRIFDEQRSKCLNLDYMIGTQSQTDTTVMYRQRGCRFLTPDEYRKKSRKRKKKVITSPSRKVPKVETCESNVLEGLSFCVLEGLYLLNDSSFEARSAQEGGWAHMAEEVETEEDVIKFIKKHGGSYKAEVTGAPKEYIIGGSKDDARVKTRIDGLRCAKSQAGSKKKADKSLASLARHHDGILNWTFVYYLVHMLQKETKGGSLKCADDTYLTPEPHHYLVRVARNESIEETLFNLNRLISVHEMEHALATPVVAKSGPWQLTGTIDLAKEERWVLSASFASFWPYGIDAPGNGSAFVVYPDIFSSGFGFSVEKDATEESLSSDSKSARWEHVESRSDEIMSVLPLVSAMGGLITPHLHSGVTHIICLLEVDAEMHVEDAKSTDVFICKERGSCLIEYLGKQFPENNAFRLVSPDWIRNKLE